tara:strand:+ start:99 stop:4193 length:4095 start_codon:yes stop_codon:yes gene_type:complete
MVKKDFKKIEGFNQTLNRFKGKKHKSVISNTLRGNSKVKKNTHISAYDPATRQFVSGSLKEVGIALKVSPATLSKRLKSGDKAEMKDVKGFIIGRHKTAEAMIDYRNEIKKIDTIVEKAKPILDGGEYLDLLKPNYNLINGGVHTNEHFGIVENRFSLVLNDNLTLDDIAKIIDGSINSVVSANNLKEGRDKIRFVIMDENLNNPISTPPMYVEEMTMEIVLNLIESAVESNEEFVLSDDTQIIITSINGEDIEKKKQNDKKKNKKLYKGWSSNNDVDSADQIAEKVYDEDEKQHKLNTSFKASVIQIKNKDSLCIPRAIAVGYFMALEGINSKNYDNAKRGRKIQLEKAEELVKEYEELCGKEYDGNGFALEDLEAFEFITGLSITAIDGDNSLNVVYPEIEKGGKYIPPEDNNQTIYLYLHTENDVPHCDLINNGRVAGFFGRHYFCHKCKKCYEKKDCHKCVYACKMCCKAGCPTIKEDKSKIKYHIFCDDCDRFFPNETCYENHKLSGSQYDAKNGKKTKVVSKALSVCDRIWKCQDCKKVMKKDIQPKSTHICGDYLCNNCKQIVHKDHKCYMLPKKINMSSDKYIYFDFECDIEVNETKKEHEVMFAISMYHNDPKPIEHHNIDEWCKWAFSKENKDHTFIAHNGMGYDYRFIVRWVFNNTIYEPFIIWGGQKIITMSIKELGIRFIDSLSFITMPLKCFPKTFGQKELKKGYFPHWFNTKKNRNHIGEIPSIDYFKPERFSVSGHKDFMVWYEERSKEEWNEEKEMREYCISDVDILRKCCIQFRNIYLDIAGIDPFTYLTIASVCMAIYKYYYIDETFPQRTEQINQMKKKLGNVSKLKGAKLEIWNAMIKRYEQDTLEAVFSEKKLAVFSFKDVEWMRNAFFGGRTNAVKLIYHFKEGEEGVYSDITSLYPTVNYYDIYPKGHPIILKEEDIEQEHYKRLHNREYLGFFDITITPPKDLYHPVLPTKGEKLVFDLLPKRGIFCSNEVYVALDMGYVIDEIHEIRYFEEGTKSLFKGYVAKFLKIKQEASGYPDWVLETNNPKSDMPDGYSRDEILLITEEDRKDLYIHLYELGQGILLDKSKIDFNAGMRAISKLCLNSLWGKFGQRTNMGKCEIVSTKQQYLEILYNPKYENVQWIDIAEDKLQVSYVIKEEYVENDYNTNMAVACFTTSRARMRLYEEALKTLDRQVLYFDTDSVVYVYDKNNPKHIRLRNGDFLGDWTDEIEGAKMVGVFVSGGPKNYSYETLAFKDNKPIKATKTKVKGITLNKETCALINHYTIIDLIENSLMSGNLEENKIVANWHGIKRVQNNGLENISMTKKYGLCYTKRAICLQDKYGDYDTRPFGWDYKANGDWE